MSFSVIGNEGMFLYLETRAISLTNIFKLAPESTDFIQAEYLFPAVRKGRMREDKSSGSLPRY